MKSKNIKQINKENKTKTSSQIQRLDSWLPKGSGQIGEGDQMCDDG